VLPVWDRTLPTLIACLDAALRRIGEAPVYAPPDNGHLSGRRPGRGVAGRPNVSLRFTIGQTAYPPSGLVSAWQAAHSGPGSPAADAVRRSLSLTSSVTDRPKIAGVSGLAHTPSDLAIGNSSLWIWNTSPASG
jgi:hypothetical protein